MIFYNPAFDFHHSLFRTLLLLREIRGEGIEPEKLRILDFYLLFPREISEIHLNPLQRPIKRQFLKYPQYEEISSPAKVFYRLEPIFESAVKVLVASGIVEADPVDNTLLRLSSKELPTSLSEALENRAKESAEVVTFLVKELYPYPLYGPHGLKARTSLLPSKHDRDKTVSFR